MSDIALYILESSTFRCNSFQTPHPLPIRNQRLIYSLEQHFEYSHLAPRTVPTSWSSWRVQQRRLTSKCSPCPTPNAPSCMLIPFPLSFCLIPCRLLFLRPLTLRLCRLGLILFFPLLTSKSLVVQTRSSSPSVLTDELECLPLLIPVELAMK